MTQATYGKEQKMKIKKIYFIFMRK